MHTGKYLIAGVVVEIQSVYVGVHYQCADYRCDDAMPAAVHIHTTPEDIRQEQVKSDREAVREGREAQEYLPPYLESLAVYRKLAKVMLLEQDTLLFHGSAVAVEDRAVLFTACSGTGKSTHTALWRQLLGERCYMVNDDKPLLRIGADGVQVCGTPWNGKHNLGTNCVVPLKAICILERGQENRIERLPAGQALPFLLQQSYRPEDPRAMPQLLKLLNHMTEHVAFYRLQCNMDPEAAKLAYETMLGQG